MKPLDDQSSKFQREDDLEILLKPSAACGYLRENYGVERSPVTLRNLRLKGGGPPFHKFGNEVFYTPKGLDGWVRQKLSKLVFSTSELPGRAA